MSVSAIYSTEGPNSGRWRVLGQQDRFSGTADVRVNQMQRKFTRTDADKQLATVNGRRNSSQRSRIITLNIHYATMTAVFELVTYTVKPKIIMKYYSVRFFPPLYHHYITAYLHLNTNYSNKWRFRFFSDILITLNVAFYTSRRH